MISYNFKINKDWARMLGDQLDAAIEKAGNYAVAKLYHIIIKRTNEGLDYENKAFIPYSKEYLVARSKRGRGVKVNLQMTSQMIQSVTVAHKTGSLTWTIAAHGSDSNGVSNAMKVHYLATDKKPRIFLKLGKTRLAYLQKAFRDGLSKSLGQVK